MSYQQKVTIGDATLYQGDCMAYMATLPDKAFGLAIVDPPYGIGASRATGTYAREATNYTASSDKQWDLSPPDADYFRELFRVSVNQIVWGGNYMTKHLPSSQGWVCWYKTDELKGRDFSEFELAFTSFKRASRHIEMRPFVRNGTRIHPTQKPVKLYEWLLTNYAKPGERILDTHGGSMSSVIACMNLGFAVTCCELDTDYFAAGVDRLRDAQRQQPMFAPERAKQVQEALV